MAFDPTKPVRLRSGLEAAVYKADVPDECYQIHGAYKAEDGRWWAGNWTADGSFFLTAKIEHPLDLVNVPEKRTVEFWVVTYASGRWSVFSKKPSEYYREDGEVIACLHIVREYEVGEGLE